MNGPLKIRHMSSPCYDRLYVPQVGYTALT